VARDGEGSRERREKGESRKEQRTEMAKWDSLTEDTPRDAVKMHFAYIYIILLIRLSKLNDPTCTFATALTTTSLSLILETKLAVGTLGLD
jgi:hypothetical protein